MDIKYIQTDESEEFHTEERCHILELLNHPDDRNCSLSRARVEPGITTAWHRLRDTDEIYYILSGVGQMEIGESFSQEVKPNDVIKIPKNTAQRIKNVGTEDLIFLCICTPAFGAECYEELE